MRECIYPGTFDPITNGHMDIIKRASKLFDKVIIAVATSIKKQPMFDVNMRVKMAQESTKNIQNVEVKSFDTLLVEFAKTQKIRVCIRGLRAVSDFEYELQIGYANATLWNEFETIYLMPNLQNAFISSTIVRDILSHNGNVEKLVPNAILPFIGEH